MVSAVDGSESAHEAFKLTVQLMDKEKDTKETMQLRDWIVIQTRF
jgi:hypothetical protein